MAPIRKSVNDDFVFDKMINETKCESFPSIHEPEASQTQSRFSSRLIWVIVLLMGLIVVVRYFMALCVGGGSGDFYYYIIVAREWLQLLPGEYPRNPTWLFYTPGIFRFYQAFMLNGVTSFEGLSIAIHSLYLFNALLITLILWRMKVHPILSIWAGIWSLFIIEHFQGFSGTTEPLVVLPMLLGLAWAANQAQTWWQGRALLYVGAGLALSIYAKQQGVLFLAGALFALFWSGNWRQFAWFRHACILAGVASGIFLLLLAAEPGTLMEVLMPKIQAVLGYHAEDVSMWRSLGGEGAAEPKLGYLLLVLVEILLCLRFLKAGKSWLATPAGALFAICACMALASTWQVHTRPYNHYLLLTWPPLIIACTIAIHIALQHLSISKWRRLTPWAMLLIVVFPFTRMKYGPYYGPWFIPQPTGVAIIDAYLETWGLVPYYDPWFFPKPTIIPKIGVPVRTYAPVPAAFQDTLTELRKDLRDTTAVVVMPSEYDFVYWNLNLRHPLANYSYPQDDSAYVRALKHEQTQAVICFPNDRRFRHEWLEQARAARFVEIGRKGQIILMRRTAWAKE